MLVCGANGMGFYNVRDHVWACGFDSCGHEAPGNVALISHSGSGMSGLIDSEARLRINFAVSTGNELGVTMDEYLDFVLDLPETKAVGLFVETARNPQGFRAALAKALERRIPVVALKTGRTIESAQLTVSHSGAMAGDDAAYEALFDRYGVQRVRDMDELATALILFAELPPIGPGGPGDAARFRWRTAAHGRPGTPMPACRSPGWHPRRSASSSRSSTRSCRR